MFNNTSFQTCRNIITHFVSRLKDTPLLLGWLILGPVVALLTDGWLGFGLGLVNIVLIGVYAILIRWLTPESSVAKLVKHPHVELVVALVLVSGFLITQFFDFGVWTAQPWYGWVRGTFISAYKFVANLRFIPEWALMDVYLALSSTLKKLIPTLAVFWLLGYRRADMGLSHPHWKLTAILTAVTTVFGLVTGVFFQMPFKQTLVLFVVGIFVNALPEELFFRGFLLSRLEKVCRNPLNALVISALLFNALHVPIQIHNGLSPLSAFVGIFSIGYPTGLIWGYLYLRTRSIIPSTLWHATNGHLGFILMNM